MVIAILAAIVTVAYNGVTRNASESSVKADLRNAATKLALYKAESGKYPSTAASAGVSLNQKYTFNYSGAEATFCLQGRTGDASTSIFYITQDGDIKEGECPLVWTYVAAGRRTTLAIATGGIPYGWGDSSLGQAGHGYNKGYSTPGIFTNASGIAEQAFVQMDVGKYHGVGLRADGAVYAWGYNDRWGQVGNNGGVSMFTPVSIANSGELTGKTIKSVRAGEEYSLALGSDGTLYGWGFNGNGQLGDGTVTSRTTPVILSSSGSLAGKTVTDIAASRGYSYALTSDGVLYGWGSSSGNIGTTPTVITDLGPLTGKTVTDIVAKESGRLTVLTSDGAVYEGWYGGGSFIAMSASAPLLGKVVTQIAAGDNHTLALDSDGKVYAWGDNAVGQLGDSTTITRSTPVAISNTGVLSGKKIVQVAAGTFHSLALASDGSLYSWGHNYEGELGDGTKTARPSPGVVLSPPR